MQEQERPGGLTGEVFEDVIRSEEHLAPRHDAVEAGRVRVHKRVVSEPFTAQDSRAFERAEVERIAADPDDDGEVHTYDDGSMSVPVFEEELVVTHRTVVKERILVRKQTDYEPVSFEVDLRHEEIDVTADESLQGRVSVPRSFDPQ